MITKLVQNKLQEMVVQKVVKFELNICQQATKYIQIK